MLFNIQKSQYCAISKRYLQTLISNKASYLQVFDDLIVENVSENIINQENEDNEDLSEDFAGSFMSWASLIADDCLTVVDKIKGEFDNAQYTTELVPLVIKTMKLYSCWSGIMTNIFGYREATVSSSLVESNFNQIKNRLFKYENLPIRVDDFVQKLISYYKGDHLLIKNSELLIKISVSNNDNKNDEENIQTDIQNNEDIQKESVVEDYEDIHRETGIEANTYR